MLYLKKNFEAPCTAGTYFFFQVVKCSSIDFHFHLPIRGTEKVIERLPDPFLYDVMVQKDTMKDLDLIQKRSTYHLW